MLSNLNDLNFCKPVMFLKRLRLEQDDAYQMEQCCWK